MLVKYACHLQSRDDLKLFQGPAAHREADERLRAAARERRRRTHSARIPTAKHMERKYFDHERAEVGHREQVEGSPGLSGKMCTNDEVALVRHGSFEMFNWFQRSDPRSSLRHNATLCTGARHMHRHCPFCLQPRVLSLLPSRRGHRRQLAEAGAVDNHRRDPSAKRRPRRHHRDRGGQKSAVSGRHSAPRFSSLCPVLLS